MNAFASVSPSRVAMKSVSRPALPGSAAASLRVIARLSSGAVQIADTAIRFDKLAQHGSAAALQFQIVRCCPCQFVHHPLSGVENPTDRFNPHALHVAQVLGDTEYDVVGRLFGNIEIPLCP